MSRELLLDTSALVSLLDRSQTHHQACVAFYRSWRGAVVTTEAVLTEATHLLGRVHGGRATCLEFFVRGGATLVPSGASSLRAALALVRRCEDQPMDYADATLVVLADDLDAERVFTLDRDFDVSRRSDGTPPRRVPEAL